VNNIAAIFIPTISLGLGFLLAYASWKSYANTRNIDNWEITEGIITKSSLKLAGAAYLPDIEYQYFVLGVEYKGTGVTVVPDIMYDVKVAQGLLEEYPVGKKVDVFYNPEVYRVAVLEKESQIGVSWVSLLVGLTALGLLIFGVAFLLRVFQ